MTGTQIYESWCSGAGAEPRVELPGDPPVTAGAQPWLRWGLTGTGQPPGEPSAVELGLVGPHDPGGLGAVAEPVLRLWSRGAEARDDAQVVLSWLRGNALSERSGVDTDMLVQLFIEAVLGGPDGAKDCDGDYLSTITGTAHWVGATIGWQWSLRVNLPAPTIAAALEAIADSGPQWRYAIVAVQDPDSPAGRIRRRLLADLGG